MLYFESHKISREHLGEEIKRALKLKGAKRKEPPADGDRVLCYCGGEGHGEEQEAHTRASSFLAECEFEI